MLGKDLSEALGGISEDKIEAAANVAPKSRRHIWVRMAACAAVLAILLTTLLRPGETKIEGGQIVALPGVLKAYACDLENVEASELEQYALLEGVENSYTSHWSPYLDLISAGITMTFVVDNAELQKHELAVEVSTNYGTLRGHHYAEKYWVEGDLEKSRENACFGQSGTVDNAEVVYWEGTDLWHSPQREKIISGEGRVFIDVIVYSEDHIVGYVVLEAVLENPDLFMFGLTLLESACFPMVDGQFQNVTKEYVDQQIAQVKAG